MGTITFNGVSSSTIPGLIIEHPPAYRIPGRKYTFTHIPGRNGDFISGDISFENVQKSYEIALIAPTGTTITEYANKLANWLYSVDGYARLTDSYDSSVYMLATYKNSVDLSNLFTRAGQAMLEFECKPQRFLISGETPVTISTSHTLMTNLYNFTALPKIKVLGSGSGTVSIENGIQSTTVSISDIGTGLYIDCDLQEAYTLTTPYESKNSVISCDEFPALKPGANYINFTGGVTSVEVTPNWWTL